MPKDDEEEKQEYVFNEADARIWRAFREPKPAVVDLSSPIETGMVFDRNNNEIAPHVLPNVRNEDEVVAGGINDAIDATMVADWLYRGNENKALPEGWKRVQHPDLKDDMETAGAYHLVSPSGMQFLAFGSSAKKNSPGESIKQAFGLSSKAKAAARIGRALDDNYDITYAGHGRGGALAKVSSEAASTFVSGTGDNVRPKTCVAIDATSVPPGTYQANGLAVKGHARTTVAISRTTDALGKFKRRFATSEQVTVKERSNDRKIVGGPRSGETRDPVRSERFDVHEHLAHTDLKIKLEGSLKLEESPRWSEQKVGRSKFAAEGIKGYVREDILRKHLLAASRGDNHESGRKVMTR